MEKELWVTVKWPNGKTKIGKLLVLPMDVNQVATVRWDGEPDAELFDLLHPDLSGYMYADTREIAEANADLIVALPRETDQSSDSDPWIAYQDAQKQIGLKRANLFWLAGELDRIHPYVPHIFEPENWHAPTIDDLRGTLCLQVEDAAKQLVTAHREYSQAATKLRAYLQQKGGAA